MNVNAQARAKPWHLVFTLSSVLVCSFSELSHSQTDTFATHRIDHVGKQEVLKPWGRGKRRVGLPRLRTRSTRYQVSRRKKYLRKYVSIGDSTDRGEYGSVRIVFQICRTIRAEAESVCWGSNKLTMDLYPPEGRTFDDPRETVEAMSETAMALLRNLEVHAGPFSGICYSLFLHCASADVTVEVRERGGSGKKMGAMAWQDCEETWKRQVGERMLNFQGMSPQTEERKLYTEDLECLLRWMWHLDSDLASDMSDTTIYAAAEQAATFRSMMNAACLVTISDAMRNLGDVEETWTQQGLSTRSR